jgi:hypothetical protein
MERESMDWLKGWRPGSIDGYRMEASMAATCIDDDCTVDGNIGAATVSGIDGAC